jgi:hypothetical protein
MDTTAIIAPEQYYPRAVKQSWLPQRYYGIAVTFGFAVFTLFCILVGAASFIRYAYPALVFIISIYLYRYYPVTYLSWVLWLWYLSPFCRRLIDYRGGWVDPSPVLLAPHLATVVAGLALFGRPPVILRSRASVPLLMALAALAYGTAIGLLRVDAKHVAISLINWLSPLTLGVFIFTRWREYPAIRETLRRTWLWGVAIMGAYGVYQFIAGPPWDLYWLINVGYGSFGVPEATKLRVFSTMNAPGTLAPWIMTGLLLLFANRLVIAVPAAIFGYCTFLLGLERTAWIGWLVGITVILILSRMRVRINIIAALIAMSLFVVPFAIGGPFAEVIAARMRSFTDGKDDVSYVARYEGHKRFFADALESPFGKGIGAMDKEYAIDIESEAMGPHDSAIVELILSLGWFGAAIYLGAIVSIVYSTLRTAPNRDDLFQIVSRAIIVSIFVQFPLGSVMIASPGVILWCFSGAELAAQRYYREQKSIVLAEAAA